MNEDRLSVGITAEMLEEVEVVAEARGIDRSELLRRWIEERLEIEMEGGVKAAPSGRLPAAHESAVRREVIAAIVRAVDELTEMAVEDLAVNGELGASAAHAGTSEGRS